MSNVHEPNALSRVRDEITTGRLGEIDDFLLEWIAEHSTDEVARNLARQAFDRRNED